MTRPKSINLSHNKAALDNTRCCFLYLAQHRIYVQLILAKIKIAIRYLRLINQQSCLINEYD